MKNILFIIIILFLFIGCVTGHVTGSADLLRANTFEEAERIAIDIFWVYNDDYIDEIVDLFPKEVMAVWGTMNGEFSDEIASNYEVKMARHGLLVVTRSRIRLINREFEFQFSGFVNSNDISAYGQIMGVSKIVVIEASRNGNYRDISVLDIESGLILYSANINLDYILESILIHNNIPFN